MTTIEGECEIIDERPLAMTKILQKMLDDSRENLLKQQVDAIRFGRGFQRKRFIRWTVQKDPNNWSPQ